MVDLQGEVLQFVEAEEAHHVAERRVAVHMGLAAAGAPAEEVIALANKDPGGPVAERHN